MRIIMQMRFLAPPQKDHDSISNPPQVRCLSLFIDTAFDMQRDMIVTPKRIEYAKTKEAGLYEALMEIASNKQEEIRQLILETIGGNSEALIKEAAVYNFIGVVISEDGQVSSIRDLKNCTSQIQDLVLSRINNSFAGKLVASVEILKESFTGVKGGDGCGSRESENDQLPIY